MLWVYEGLNEYIGMLLATRAGFNDSAYMRDYLGRIASDYAHETGRDDHPARRYGSAGLGITLRPRGMVCIAPRPGLLR